MSIFLFSLGLSLLSLYTGYKLGKYSFIERLKHTHPIFIKKTNEYPDSLMKEVDRRKKISTFAKSRKRVNGRFVKE